MKLSIIYYSKSGKTKEMAEHMITGMESVEGIQAVAFDLDHIDADYVNESKAVVFGTPIYTANICWQMKKWLDEPSKCKLAGKLGAVFATAGYAQGAPGAGLSTMIDHLLVHGMLVYSSGCSMGQPLIHLGAVALKENFEQSKPLFFTFGQRIASKAIELFEHNSNH